MTKIETSYSIFLNLNKSDRKYPNRKMQNVQEIIRLHKPPEKTLIMLWAFSREERQKFGKQSLLCFVASVCTTEHVNCLSRFLFWFFNLFSNVSEVNLHVNSTREKTFLPWKFLNWERKKFIYLINCISF